jgi:hypothetical protein
MHGVGADHRAATVGRRQPRSGGGRIYFWASHHYPAELWSMRPDGSQQRLLYKTPLWAKRPAPSPDGRWITFDGAPQDTPLPSQSQEPQTSGDFDVQLVRVDGSGRRTLAGTPEREVDAAWSPDRARLSYSRYPGRGPDAWRQSWIWTVGSDGRGARRLARSLNALVPGRTQACPGRADPPQRRRPVRGRRPPWEGAAAPDRHARA